MMLTLLPYTFLDRRWWSIDDSEVLKFATEARDQGLLHTVFHDGKVSEPLEFLEAMQRPDNLPVFVAEGRKIIGFAWLNGIAGFHAFPHFGFLQNTFAYEAGCQLLEYWSGFERIRVLLGVIAASNRPALAYAMRLGFRHLGDVPEMLDVHGEPQAGCVMYRKNDRESYAQNLRRRAN